MRTSTCRVQGSFQRRVDREELKSPVLGHVQGSWLASVAGQRGEGAGLLPPRLHAERLDVVLAFPAPAQPRACNLDGKPPNGRSDCSGLPARSWLPACRLLRRRGSWRKPRHQTELRMSRLQDHWLQPTTFPFLKMDLPTEASRLERNTGNAHTPFVLRASALLCGHKLG